MVTVLIRHRFVAYGTVPGHNKPAQTGKAADSMPAVTKPRKGRATVYEDDDDDGPLAY